MSSTEHAIGGEVQRLSRRALVRRAQHRAGRPRGMHVRVDRAARRARRPGLRGRHRPVLEHERPAVLQRAAVYLS